MRSMLIAALLGSVLFTGCDPSLLPGDDDDTVISGDVTVTVDIGRPDAFDLEIDGHAVDHTVTLQEGGPYEIEVIPPGIDPRDAPWARPPCEVTVAHGKAEVVTYNNPRWAEMFNQPETIEFSVRDGGMLNVPTIDTPYAGWAWDCAFGPSHSTVFLQTEDGQEITGQVGGVLFNRELVAIVDGQGRLDATFDESYTEIEGAITYDLGDQLNIHCDRL